MPSSSLSLDQPQADAVAALRASLGQSCAGQTAPLPFGLPEMDDRLADQGLHGAGLHEIAAASATLNDDAAATLFAAGIAARFAASKKAEIFWALSRFDLYAPGLEQVGLGPDRIFYAQGLKDSAVLAMAEDGLRTAHLACLIVDGSEQRIAIGTARATRDSLHLKRMLAMRVERIDPGLGIEAMTLAAPRVETLAAQTIEAGLGQDDRPRDIATLVDQLSGRIEPDRPFRLSSHESDVPERAVRRVAPLAKPLGWPDWKRPVRMLRRPELLVHVVALMPDHPPRRFTWRGKSYRVIAGDGPERIHGEWWRNEDEMWAVRDYFRVEAAGGERFWLFRRGDGVDAQTGNLSWFMHGMFG